MKNLIKKIFIILPIFLRRFFVFCYEHFFSFIALKSARKESCDIKMISHNKNEKLRILFYHPSGLSFGGSEKFLQIFAKHIDKNKYDIFFLYSPKPRITTGLDQKLDGRLSYLENEKMELISFDYSRIDSYYPFFIHQASPNIFDVINKYGIDLIVYSGSGYTEFPINLIKKIPIIMINNFGSFNIQKNIKYNICVSKEVAKKVELVTLPEKIKIIPVLSDGPSLNSKELGLKLREKLNILNNSFLFGRIGRPSDNIFDPIGINAFKKLVANDNSVHYLIMSPMPIIIKIVEEEKIPNVHFLPASAKEEDVWAFHQAIDCLAHFRLDGESFGLNIAESMLAGKPIISHCSPVWNAHTEYLDESFSRIANIGDVNAYYNFMKEMVELKKSGKITELGIAAKTKAEKLFLIKNRIKDFEELVDKAIK